MAHAFDSSIVTRFAPSPTGYLHLGNARTALFNFLAARKFGGRFILRVEDTDTARSEERHTQALLQDLRWLGLSWEEGPDIGGHAAPYRQSERHALYNDWLAKLDAQDLTYPCYCSQTELNIARKMQISAGQPPRYLGTCRNLTAAQRAEREARGIQPAIRFRVPSGKSIVFDDVVHGEQKFLSDDIGDFIVRRADGSSAFFFSNAIDDALMGVTLVLRGDDHLANTPRQLMLLEAFGLPAPRYGHMAMMLGMDGSPLSKRHGSTSLHEFRERGFLPIAVCNQLIRLGHSVAHDVWLDAAACIKEFELSRLGRAPARFDETQLRHWQKESVARLSAEELQSWVSVELPPELNAEQRSTFCSSVRNNIETPADIRVWLPVAFGAQIECSDEARAVIKDAGATFFNQAAELLPKAGLELKVLTKELSVATSRKGPALFMPLRAALTGHTHGPELGPLLPIIGMEKIRLRLAAAGTLANS
ncbi:MAG TPA: glutamate--tRNA ligase [Steroidobacteraceae bacterium]|nr:glutamate--tRNA ligase [Steroidobacteraceae bacterium]